MINLSLLEREYLAELVKKDLESSELVALKFGVFDTANLIKHLKKGQSFVKDEEDVEDVAVDLCPDCKVYCEKKFIDGRCE
jgi:hypothetical protein